MTALKVVAFLVAFVSSWTILGHLSAIPPVPAGIVRGQVGNLSRGADVDHSGFVVWIDGIDGEFPPPEEHEVLDQKNLRFVPHVLAILVGTIVEFPNSDDLSHNVFSIAEAKRFNLGLYSKQHTMSVRFDKPGVVDVLCNVHLEMSAYIVILENPYFAVTGPDGKYVIRDVPAGNHTVRCWSKTGSTEKKEVLVQAGRVITANFPRGRQSFLRRPKRIAGDPNAAETASLAITHKTNHPAMTAGGKDG